MKLRSESGHGPWLRWLRRSLRPAIVLAVAVALAPLVPVKAEGPDGHEPDCTRLGGSGSGDPVLAAGRIAAELADVSIETLSGGVADLVDRMTSELEARFAAGAQIPMVGDTLSGALTPLIQRLDDFRAGVRDFTNLLRQPTAASVGALQAGLYLALHDGADPQTAQGLTPDVRERLESVRSTITALGLHVLQDGPDRGHDVGLDDIAIASCRGIDAQKWLRIDLHIGQRLTDTTEGFGFDLPFENVLPGMGVSLAAPAGLVYDLRWDARLGFGVTNLNSHKRDNFFVDAGKTLTDGHEGEEIPELHAEVTLTPQVDDDHPRLTAHAGLGVLTADISDGIPFPVSVSASAKDAMHACEPDAPRLLCGPSDPHGFTVRARLAGQGAPAEWHVVHTGSNEGPFDLLYNLNEAIYSATKTDQNGDGKVDEKDAPNLFPPFVATLDFSRISGLTPNSGSTPRLQIVARQRDIRSMEIIGGEDYGFLPRERDELEALALGFAHRQASTGDAGRQELVAEEPLPDGGVLTEDEFFRVQVGDTKVEISLNEVRLRDVTTTEGLFERVADIVGTAVRDKVGLDGDAFEVLPVEDGGHIRLKFVASRPRPGVDAPRLEILTPAGGDLDRSRVTVRADVDLLPSEKYIPANLRLDDLRTYPLLFKANFGADTVEPSIAAETNLRLRVDGMAGPGRDVQAQLGASGASIGLPAIGFDLRADAVVKLTPEGVEGGLETLEFDHTSVDVGEVVHRILGPVGSFAGGVMAPFFSVIGGGAAGADALLTQPLPGISDIVGHPVSLYDTITESDKITKLDLAANIRQVLRIAAGLAELGTTIERLSQLSVFDFGCLAVETRRGKPFFGRPIPCELHKAFREIEGLREDGIDRFMQVKKYRDVAPPGFQLDLLQLPQLANLVTGQPARLVSFQLPKFNIGPQFLLNFDFQLLRLKIDAKAKMVTDLALVYDSSGLAEVARAARSGVTPSPDSLLRGAYLEAPGGEIGGEDVPVGNLVSLLGKFFAAGGINAGVFDVNALIDLAADLVLKLRSPEGNDGQLRYNEIESITAGFTRPENLFCLFQAEIGTKPTNRIEASGKIAGQSVGTASLGLDVGRLNLTDLLDQRFQICAGVPRTPDVPPPVLAELAADQTLVVNVGERAPRRVHGDTVDEGAVDVRLRSVGSPGMPGAGVEVRIIDPSSADPGLRSGLSAKFPGMFRAVTVPGTKLADRIDASSLAVPLEFSAGAGNDSVEGGLAADRISGGDGDDILGGGGGDDAVAGGPGSDHLGGGAGNDVVTGDEGDDAVTGDSGEDVLDGRGGADLLQGGSGKDRLLGGDGDDRLMGGTGDDVLDGQGERDALDGEEGDDNLVGGPATDHLGGGTGDDYLNGAGEDDVLAGGLGRDTLDGGPGADAFLGDQGDDEILAGPGDVGADGGEGTDRVVFADDGSTGQRTLTQAGVSTTQYRLPLGLTAVEELRVDLDDAEGVLVDGAAVPTVIRGVSGTHTVTVRSAAAPVRFEGGPAADTLVVDRRSQTDGLAEGRVEDGALSGFGLSEGIGGGPDRVSYAGIDAVSVLLGAGSDTVRFVRTSAGTRTEVLGGDGADRAIVDAVSGGGTVLAGPAVFDGGPGPDTMQVDVPGAPAPATPPALVAVEAYAVDNRANTGPAVRWTVADGSVRGNGTEVVKDTFGTTVRVIGAGRPDDEAEFAESTDRTQVVHLDGDGARIVAQGARALEPRGTGLDAKGPASFIADAEMGLLFTVDRVRAEMRVYHRDTRLHSGDGRPGLLARVSDPALASAVSLAVHPRGIYAYVATGSEILAFAREEDYTGAAWKRRFAWPVPATALLVPGGGRFVVYSRLVAGRGKLGYLELDPNGGPLGYPNGDTETADSGGPTVALVATPRRGGVFFRLTPTAVFVWRVPGYPSGGGYLEPAYLRVEGKTSDSFTDATAAAYLQARADGGDADHDRLYVADRGRSRLYAVGLRNGGTAFSGEVFTATARPVGAVQAMVGATSFEPAYRPQIYLLDAAANSLSVFERQDASGQLTFLQQLRQGVRGVHDLDAPRAIIALRGISELSDVYTVSTGEQGGLAWFRGIPVTGGVVPESAVRVAGVGLFRVTSGAGDDQVAVGPMAIPSSPFPDRPVPVLVLTGDGGDTVDVATAPPPTSAGGAGAQSRTQLTLDLGAGDDVTTVLSNGPGSDVRVLGGAGKDRADIVQTDGASTQLQLGDDADTVRVQASVIRAEVEVRSGNPQTDPGDTLVLAANPGAQLPANPGKPRCPTEEKVRATDAPPGGIVRYCDVEFVTSEGAGATASAGGPYSMAEGDSLPLDASRSVLPPGRPWRFDWDVDGDGSFGDVTGPKVTLPWPDLATFGVVDQGQRVVRVLVSDGTVSSVATAALEIANHPPTVTLSGAETVDAHDRYTATVNVTDPGADTVTRVSIAWDGPAGPTETVAGTGPIAHVFDAPGDHAVTVVSVTDEDGSYRPNLTHAVKVRPVGAVEIAGANHTVEGSTYAARLSGPYTVDHWRVEWGDGAVDEVRPQSVKNGTATAGVEHVYADGPAEFLVSAVAVLGADIERKAATPLRIAVADAPPGVVATGSAAEITEGSDFRLSLRAQDSGADEIREWRIDWGDGSVEALAGKTTSAAHRYPRNRSFTVVAAASDEDGTYTANPVAVNVKNVPPFITGFDAEAAEEGGIVALRATANDPGGNITYGFDLDGDNIIDTPSVDGTTTVSVPDDGPRRFTVLVTDPDGASAIRFLTVTVPNVAPVSRPALNGVRLKDPTDPPVVVVPEGSEVTFDPGVIDPGQDSVSGYVVDWGDGKTTTTHNGAPTRHVYADGPPAPPDPRSGDRPPATHQVTLRSVTDEDGKFPQNVSIGVAVRDVAPSLELQGADTVTVPTDDPYRLTLGELVAVGDDPITRYAVDWGDGFTEPYTGEPVPGTQITHLFRSPGERTVTVFVTDDEGTWAAGTKLVRVGVLTMTTSANPSLVGQPVTVTATVGVPPTRADDGSTRPGAAATGPVTFFDGDTALATVGLADGQASHSVRLGAGLHRLRAVFGGDAAVPGATAEVTQMVRKADTVTSLGVGPATSDLGQAVRLSATVAVVPPGAGVAAGMVSFLDGDTVIGGATLIDGHGEVTVALPPGPHALSARYAGNDLLEGSASPVIGHLTRTDVTVGDVAVDEAEVADTEARIPVRLAAPSTLPVSLHFATVPGTARPGADYESRAGEVVFRPGETSAEIVVPVRAQLVHGAKTFSVSLSEPAVTARLTTTAVGVTVNATHPTCTVVGTLAADTLGPREGSQVYCGLGGDDVIAAGGGDDVVYGGTGIDRLHGGPGDDRLVGGPGDDRLYGSAGADRLLGGAGADTLYGHEAEDTLIDRLLSLDVPGAFDRLWGDDGDDDLAGGDGDDVLYGDDGRDGIVDRLTGTGLAGPLFGFLLGPAGDDRLVGGSGADRLFGQNGDDHLDGRDGVSGNDRLSAGGGRDTCVADEGDSETSC